MKRILILSVLTVTAASCSGQFFQKLLGKKPKPYENTFLYFFLKPVNIDTGNIKDDVTYMVEALQKDQVVTLNTMKVTKLKPVLGFVKGDYLKQIMRLDWNGSIGIGTSFPGRGFTANYLDRGSFLSQKDIHDPTKFDQQQIETLERDRDKEKFEIRSTIPIDVCGEIIDETFYLIECKK